jgi:hypothetical protein
MATGDQADMVARLRAVLPASWFPQPAASGASASPVLDAILNGAAAAAAWLHALTRNAVAQARICTATGVFLDGIAADFFGAGLQRNVAEGDPAFRARIKATLLLPQGTRAGMMEALRILTGRTPRIVEPWNTGDTGGWSQGALAYGAAGCYGSLLLPAQVFVTAYRPDGSGIAQVAGYYGSGDPTGPGGYGAGAIEYGSAAMIEGQVTDAAIYATVNNARAAGVTAWVAISN